MRNNLVVLSIDKLAKSYRGPGQAVHALAGVDLQVGAGEFVAVQGPSGCGKTTLLLVAGGLLEPDAGQVQVAGQDLYQLSPEARARFRSERIGFVFQQFHLVPYLSVLDNVLAPALAATIPDARQRASSLVDELGLSARAAHVPAELSTGERQRTALARALLVRPRLILADEPTGNLDEESARRVLDHLSDAARAGAAVLLVTHDAAAAARAQRAVKLKEGRIECR